MHKAMLFTSLSLEEAFREFNEWVQKLPNGVRTHSTSVLPGPHGEPERFQYVILATYYDQGAKPADQPPTK